LDEAAGGPDPDEVLRDAAVPAPQTPPRPREETPVSGEQDSSYTARLLEAKKKAWKEKKE
jgi:hypothetical protein